MVGEENRPTAAQHGGRPAVDPAAAGNAEVLMGVNGAGQPADRRSHRVNQPTGEPLAPGPVREEPVKRRPRFHERRAEPMPPTRPGRDEPAVVAPHPGEARIEPIEGLVGRVAGTAAQPGGLAQQGVFAIGVRSECDLIVPQAFERLQLVIGQRPLEHGVGVGHDQQVAGVVGQRIEPGPVLDASVAVGRLAGGEVEPIQAREVASGRFRGAPAVGDDERGQPAAWKGS